MTDKKNGAGGRAKGQRRPSVLDVAELAGVSKSTAARALAGNGYASADVRQRVVGAAETLGYIPDANARSLRLGARQEVGVVVSNLRDTFYSELATGIEGSLAANGFNVVLVCDDADPAKEMQAAETFAAMRVPGVILTAVSAEAVRRMRSTGIHVVQADRIVETGQVDAVLSANEAGGRDAAAHLLDLGHRRIAMLIDEVGWTTGSGRLRGYREAFAQRSEPVGEELIVFTGGDVGSARARVGMLLDEHPDVTAIVAANSPLAEAAFSELQARDIRIPAEMSLIGYDDVPWMTMVRPSLTTVDQHTAELGRCCAELLVRRITETSTGAPLVISVAPTLVVRQSTAAPHPDHNRRPEDADRS